MPIWFNTLKGYLKVKIQLIPFKSFQKVDSHSGENRRAGSQKDCHLNVHGICTNFMPFFSQLCDVIEEALARFDYILDMKVEKTHNPFIFLATYWDLS